MDEHYLLVSDFDQTLSCHDSGHALGEMVGIDGFGDRVRTDWLTIREHVAREEPVPLAILAGA